MNARLQFSSPLEAVLENIRKKEESLWGKMQSWNHRWLARLETNPFFQNYGVFLKKPRDGTSLRSEPIDLDSLFFLSILLHLLLIFLLTRLTFSPAPLDNPEPILVHIFEAAAPAKEKKETAKKEPAKIARPRPKPSVPPATEEKKLAPSPSPEPLLPGPKVLAEAPREKVVGLTGEPLIQLPTRQSAGGQASLPTKADPPPGTPAAEETSIPEGLRRIESSQWTVVGKSGGPAALSSPDFGPYLEKIKRRVESVWQYPEGISGRHIVYLSFILDRAGKLVRVKVLDSADPKLDSSALQAMKSASPFPPIPESLQELAGEEIGIRFKVDLGVKGAR